MEWNLEQFWELYDEYIQTPVNQVDDQLVNSLKTIIRNGPDFMMRDLQRQEKNWNRRLGWEAISGGHYYFHKDQNFPYFFFKGEIIVIDYPYDRDMMFTRIPYGEEVSWNIYDLSDEMNQTNGIFIPLFDRQIILRRVENILKIQSEDNLNKLKEFFGSPRSGGS